MGLHIAGEKPQGCEDCALRYRAGLAGIVALRFNWEIIVTL